VSLLCGIPNKFEVDTCDLKGCQ